MKKYELTDQTLPLCGGDIILHRIRAVREIHLTDGTVIAPGTLGGWVEKEANLAHSGQAWVAAEARVYGEAFICGSARVVDTACVRDTALVEDNVLITGSSLVCDNACVYGSARVAHNALVSGNAVIRGHSVIEEAARVGGYAVVSGDAIIRGHSKINSSTDYITAGPAGQRDSYTTYIIRENIVNTGCYTGTLEEFTAAVERVHAANTTPLRQYRAMIAYFTSLRNNTPTA